MSLKVFITGASSGIGEALARHYAAQGATLGLVARRSEKLATLRESLPNPNAVLTLSADVSRADTLVSAAQSFQTQFGLPDIVIANAGISVGTLSEELRDYDAFEAVLRTNVLGLVSTFRPFIAPMRQRGSGSLVGVSSVAGVRGIPGAGAYSASKAAASRYLESLRVELYGSGVRVTDIRPGYIKTPMTDVNDYAMPFMLSADEAARRFAKAIARGTAQATIPWQMGLVAKGLAILPNPLYDAIFARAGRKPRDLPL